MTHPTLELLLKRLDDLTAEFQELRAEIIKAVRISEDDPEMALTRARKVLEYVVDDVYKLRVKEDRGNRSLENLLVRLVKDGHLPRRLGAYASYIRELGNVGTHVYGEDLSTEDVRRSFENLTAILEWYFEQVRPEAFMKVEDRWTEEEEVRGRAEEESRRENEAAQELAREEEKARRLKEASAAPDENKLAAGKQEWKWITDALDDARSRHEELERRAAEELKRLAEAAQVAVEAKEAETQRLPALESVPASMTNGLGIEFVWIPPGSFMMGSEMGVPNERPVHRVTINQGFYMGKYEVTQEQWQAVMGTNPSFFKAKNLPVDKVAFDDVIAFVARLNAQNDEYTYRLPSEAEWEYAARAGTTGEFAGDLDAIAWYWKNPGGRAQPVGCKEPNAFGLFDMYGNVWEWCQDWYHNSYGGAPTDGSAWLTGGEQKYHVVRGGSFKHDAAFCRAAFRLKVNWIAKHFISAGFRVVAVTKK